jgi:hypothetical protein
MADYFFELSKTDQREALQFANAQTGRPAYLLEKDLWVVWTLRALYESPLAGLLTFKGGTSLSKAYRVIDRFSEDIDLTYNIRHLLSDLVGTSDLPTSGAEKQRWTKAARARLPEWIKTEVVPIIQANLDRDKLTATLTIGGEENDSLMLGYAALTETPGYVNPIIKLEFGGRATGEPHAVMPVHCDMEGAVPEVTFPSAAPVVMSIARTFWEKATATHVYCAQHRIRGERYARHWHDLAAISRSPYFAEIIADRAVADGVANHKTWFFRERDASGAVIDYSDATQGRLRIVPEGEPRQSLAEDYAAMRDAGVLLNDAMTFDQLMTACHEIEARINQAAT